jgi:hypothetical protein
MRVGARRRSRFLQGMPNAHRDGQLEGGSNEVATSKQGRENRQRYQASLRAVRPRAGFLPGTFLGRIP